MTVRFLLDTNIVSEPLRPKPRGKVVAMLNRHEGECAIASVVWHELEFGCERLPESHRRTAIRGYLDGVVSACFPILDYDRAAAEWHAAERARLVASGRTPSFVDGQIAAIARTNRLILVSANKADFAGYEGLKVRTWQ